MGLNARGLIATACFLGWATWTIPDDRIGIGIPASSSYDRGIDWYVKGELEKALAEFNEAIRLDPASASAYCCRALVWHDKKEFDKAIADSDEAIRLDPKHAWAHNNRGNARAAKGDFAKAIADYDEAIRLDPNLAIAYKNRAWIWATCPSKPLRDGKRAIESAVRACELTDWKEPTSLGALAAAHAEAGDFDAAVKTQSRAIALIGDFDARLKAYRGGERYRSAEGLDARLSRSRPWAFASRGKPRSFFIVPYDAMLSLKPAGGSAGAVTEFGLGTSEARHTPVFTGLPRNPRPDEEVRIGFVAEGSELQFYEKSEFGDRIGWAFSNDTKTEASHVAFGDRDNSLGRGGSVVEQTGPSTWLLHLDDATSVDFDDNDGDVLIEIRLVPAKRPGKP
jgi:Tfp pilus assembly protein PilF